MPKVKCLSKGCGELAAEDSNYCNNHQPDPGGTWKIMSRLTSEGFTNDDTSKKDDRD